MHGPVHLATPRWREAAVETNDELDLVEKMSKADLSLVVMELLMFQLRGITLSTNMGFSGLD